jgi:2-oxoglutarate dehydrogenase E1 component
MEDCIIDMICYRRYGHNELDQPMYTQPQMYSKIAKHPDVIEVYGKKLVSEGYPVEKLHAIKGLLGLSC